MRLIGSSVGQRLNDTLEITKEAENIFEEDVELCEKRPRLDLNIKPNENVLTHCNTGGLATVGRGTALGVISKAYENQKGIHVYVDETSASPPRWKVNNLGT